MNFFDAKPFFIHKYQFWLRIYPKAIILFGFIKHYFMLNVCESALMI